MTASNDQPQTLLNKIIRSILKLLTGLGHLVEHIGLDPQPPPRAKVRRVDLFVEDWGLKRAQF
jgi:hypothetical protein